MTFWSSDEHEVTWLFEKSISLLSQGLWLINLVGCWLSSPTSCFNFFKRHSYSSYSNSNDKGNYETLKTSDTIINNGKLTRSPSTSAAFKGKFFPYLKWKKRITATRTIRAQFFVLKSHVMYEFSALNQKIISLPENLEKAINDMN